MKSHPRETAHVHEKPPPAKLPTFMKSHPRQPEQTAKQQPSACLIQPRSLPGRKLQVYRAQALLELRHGGRPHQGNHRQFPAHQPRQHHLVDRRPVSAHTTSRNAARRGAVPARENSGPGGLSART